MAGRGEISALAVGEQVERLVESGSDIAERGLGGFEVALGLLGLGSEPVLLGAQEIDRDLVRLRIRMCGRRRSTGTAPA